MADQSGNNATLASVVKTGIDAALKELHTALPGAIVSFDPATQLAQVQPLIKRVFKDSRGDDDVLSATDLPVLINVPVAFPRGGGFCLTFPVTAGDECLLVFCERSLDRWYRFGGSQSPGGKRFHALSDAVAMVGLSSYPNAIQGFDPDNVELKKDGGAVSIKLKADGGMDQKAATIIDITAPVINLNGAVNISGLTTMLAGAAVTGALTNNSVDVGGTHTHPQGNDSDGDSQVDTGAPV